MLTKTRVSCSEKTILLASINCSVYESYLSERDSRVSCHVIIFFLISDSFSLSRLQSGSLERQTAGLTSMAGLVLAGLHCLVSDPL